MIVYKDVDMLKRRICFFVVASNVVLPRRSGGPKNHVQKRKDGDGVNMIVPAAAMINRIHVNGGRAGMLLNWTCSYVLP